MIERTEKLGEGHRVLRPESGAAALGNGFPGQDERLGRLWNNTHRGECHPEGG